MSISPWNTSRQCVGTNRAGERCRRAAIRGGSVCDLHGGDSPQVIAKAKLRLLEAVEPAIARLIRFIESPPGLCDTCGRCDDTSAIVSAIKAVLDRSGLGPQSTLVIEPPRSPFIDLSTDELIEKTERILFALYAQRDGIPPVDEGYLLPESDETIRNGILPPDIRTSEKGPEDA